jgi:deoxyadenosine/deoxycytidine kinase
MRVVFVEGSIGVGKSSLLAALSALGHTVVQEPVEEWSEHLKLVYRDPAWRLPMQCLALSTRIERLLKAITRTRGGIVFVERSMRSSEIFAKLDPIDDAYNTIHNHYARLVDRVLEGHSTHTVYLRASVMTCMARVQERDRDGEDAISLHTMKRLHEEHEAAFADAAIIANAEQDALTVQKCVLRQLCAL